jgi:hypothetical protein
MLNPNAFAFVPEVTQSSLGLALDRLKMCRFSEKDYKQISALLTEWYASSTLEYTLKIWENHNNQDSLSVNKLFIPLTFFSYNVQSIYSRGEETLELIQKVDASFIICTEVGEKWKTFKPPDFNIFHVEGTNKNDGVIIGVGKHLKASQVETKMTNTLVVDVVGLTEPVRIIGMY